MSMGLRCLTTCRVPWLTSFRTLSSLPHQNISKNEVRIRRRQLRYMFPEFLPDPDPKFRNSVAERLMRKDMISRREKVELPEFYVGSIVAVTTSDPNLANSDSGSKTGRLNTSRFLGIVIDRGGSGLRAWIIVRNHIDGEGIEIMYNLYAPTIQKIEVIKLERRLDDELYYLRDADPKYSTFDQDLDIVILPEDSPAPLNDVVIPLNPRPWTRRWERYTSRLQGMDISQVMDPQTEYRHEVFNARMNLGWQMEYYKYDLLRHYKHTIPIEEQDAIWDEVGDALETRDAAMRKVAAQKAFVKPVKKG